MIEGVPTGSISLLLNLVFGGGLLVAWLNHRVKNRVEDRTDFGTLLAEVRQQRDEAWAKIAHQDARMTQMEVEIQGLRLARDLDPFPNWVVDLQGKYIFVNREFEKLVLEPRGLSYRDIIGQSHEDIWEGAFCRTLKALDVAARSRPDGTARAVTRIALPQGSSKVTVHKFPVRFKPSGVIVAFNGYLTDIDFEGDTREAP